MFQYRLQSEILEETKLSYKPNNSKTQEVQLKLNELHKWVSTILAVGVVVYGAMVYYVTSEDRNNTLVLQGQIDVLKQQQIANLKVQNLVVEIDKKLASLESKADQSYQLIVEVRGLREEVTKLKVELARVNRN